MSSNANDGLLEEWLNVNMPSGTIIGDPKWWAKKIRNVLGYENANLSNPQPISQDEFVLMPIELQYNQMRQVVIEYIERATNQECFLYDDFWSGLIDATIKEYDND